MSFKENFRKILIITTWCIVGAGIMVLLVAAINRKNGKTCSSSKVEINGGGQRKFIDQREILKTLTADGKIHFEGKTIASFDLRKMEDMLKKNAWIRDAQLYFDNNGVLRIRVTERKPVARIFSVSGSSFYIDSSGNQLPLPEQTTSRLPVFTGFPSDKVKVKGADSGLIRDIKKISLFISGDPFWSTDISQIGITAHHGFEMVPVLGNHIIEFGDGTDCEKKFRKLFLFYKEVSTKSGFDKYSKIDVQYDGQVVGTRRGTGISKYDSLQAIRNIQQLIRNSQDLQADTVRQQAVKPLEHNTITEQNLTNYDLPDDSADNSQTTTPVKPAKNRKQVTPMHKQQKN